MIGESTSRMMGIFVLCSLACLFLILGMILYFVYFRRCCKRCRADLCDSIFHPLSPLFMLKKPFGLINGSWPPLHCSAEATSLSLQTYQCYFTTPSHHQAFNFNPTHNVHALEGLTVVVTTFAFTFLLITSTRLC